MAADIPRVPWREVEAHLRRSWRAGQHATLLGPTGSGKTHLALALLRLRPYALVLAAKPRDPLLSGLLREGYLLVRSRRELEDLPWAGEEPLSARLLYWPTVSERRSLEEQTRLQARAMGEALHFAYATGGWSVLVDEALWFTRSLGLARELETLWVKGRSQGLSLLASAQRPAHLPLYAYSQARLFFLWRTRDGRDLDRLAEISAGVDPRLLERAIVRLDTARHEALFFDSETGLAGRVVAPAQARAKAAKGLA
jgi:hypothetical protein